MKIPSAFTKVKQAVNAAAAVNAGIEVETPLDFNTWLPFAAKTYNISSNIEDYVLRRIPLCPSDIPNRNGIAFPLSELVAYQPPPTNRQVYKAWAGCPVHVEHKNENPKDAVGVILDTYLSPIKGFNKDSHWKVMALIAVDKTKSPEMAERVANGTLTTGSMGALASSFTCSVCHAPAFSKSDIEDSAGTGNQVTNCSHISSIDDVNWKVAKNNGKSQLVYLNAHNITPTEYSLVEDPAWCMSLSDDAFTL